MPQWVSFLLDDQQYGIPLSAVERIVHAVAITALPRAPEIVLGVINVNSHILPVVDIRRRFGLPPREIRLSDHFIIGRAGRLRIALVVDASGGVVERPQEAVIAAQTVLPGLEHIEGIAKLEDGMLLIHDLNRFLSLDEERQIGETLTENFGVIHESKIAE